ncbi:MAG: hypothetical protein GY952_14200 [Rhodobacteraceae bacterium]|nr:hypothetical protein [Paracoccaceae bacterium]
MANPQNTLTEGNILAVVGRRRGRVKQQSEIIAAVVKYMPLYGPLIGITKPHRLCDWLAQCGHESAHFAYTREIGGSSQRYAPWFGRGVIQLTWLRNYQAFVRWLWKVIDPQTKEKSPDYSTAAHRDKVGNMPVAFLTAIFYWSWKNLNAHSDRNDYLNQTKRINGGTNGWSDRVHLRGRFGLMLLGYKIEKYAYRRFQADHNLPQTDRYDPATQRKIYLLLKEAPALTFNETRGDASQLEVLIMKFLKQIFSGLTSGKLLAGGGLGGLIAMLFQGFGQGDAAPIGDLAQLDWKAIISSLVAALGVGAVAQKDGKDQDEGVVAQVKAELGDFRKTETTLIDAEEVRGVARVIASGEAAEGENVDAMTEVVLELAGNGLDTHSEALTFGMRYGSILRDQAYKDRGMLLEPMLSSPLKGDVDKEG